MSSAAMINLCLDLEDPPPSQHERRKPLTAYFLQRSKHNRLVKLSLCIAIFVCIHALSRVTTRGHIGHDLRLLALGDSITWGYGSSDFNGYREHLLEALVGNTAAFVGSETIGDMRNNVHEGRPGGRIEATIVAASWGLDERPNIVLLHLGSNDLIYSDGPELAPGRMEELIEQIFQHCPDTAVLVSKLGPSWNEFYIKRFTAFNEAMEGIVRRLQDRGGHLLLLDIPPLLHPTEDFADDLHPNDSGYKKMAAGWLAGIREANKRGWILDPVTVQYIE